MSREIRLLHLELRNFKGAASVRLDLGGRDAIVRGDNATGKTTLHDAYAWVLFGKDSANRSAFEIKPLDERGRPASGIEHSVRAEFAIDGELVELSRTYAETWTKKRGSSTREFTGHSTSYAIDGVPVKQREYQDRVAALFGPEEELRIVTDPLYFAAVLPWVARRSLLLRLVGDPSDEELVELEPDLADLARILGKRTPEEHRKVVEARRREINGELTRLPVRIDEASRSLDAIGEIDATLSERLERARAELGEIERAARAPSKADEIRATQARLAREYNAAVDRETARREREMLDRASRRERLRGEIARARRALERPNPELDRVTVAEETLVEVRKSYHATRNAPTVVDVATACPTCGRELEPDALEVAIREATAARNARKAEDLRRILADGERAKANVERARAALAEEEARRADLATELERLESELESASAGLEFPALELEPAIAELLGRIRESEEELRRAEKPQELAGPSPRSIELRSVVEELARRQAAQAEASRASARIEELRAEERRLATEVERVDREIYLLELRARTRARLLTKLLNDRFELVAFRLFDEQVNGALNETCDVTVAGVPWGDLNHGARMNAGIEVLRVLGEDFGIRAPVWLDNAESVTTWRSIDAQTIRLEVSASSPKLEVELLSA